MNERIPEKITGVTEAVERFRKVYVEAISLYEESLKEIEEEELFNMQSVVDLDDEDEFPIHRYEEEDDPPKLIFEDKEERYLREPIRTRWTKQEILDLCGWPKDLWRMLRDRLETEVGLIMLRPGSGNPWKKGAVRLYTFSTCIEDREWGVYNSAALQLGAMKRLGEVTKVALAPPEGRFALNDGSEKRINRLLKKQEVKIDQLWESLQKVQVGLTDRQTLRLLARLDRKPSELPEEYRDEDGW